MRTATNEQGDVVDGRRRPKPLSPPRTWGVNVMLVDDDPADASLVRNALQRNPNVGAATVYHDPQKALEAIALGQLQPDLIFLDISMPKTNGFAFLDAMAQIAHARDIPVAFLTTSAFVRDVEHARDTMARAYIVKPASLDDLRRRLDAVVKQTMSGKWS